MRIERLLLAGLSLVGGLVLGLEVTCTLAFSDEEKQTTMSTNVGDRSFERAGQAAGTVDHESRPASAEGAESPELKRTRRQEQTLQLSPSQRLALAPHAIAVRTELLAAKQELNGIRSQLKSLPKKTAPDAAALVQLTAFSQSVNADFQRAAAHEAELTGGTTSDLASANDNKSFAQMDTSFSIAVAANAAWQNKSQDATYWNNCDQVKSDVKGLMKQIDQALDKNQSFGSDQLNVSYVS